MLSFRSAMIAPVAAETHRFVPTSSSNNICHWHEDELVVRRMRHTIVWTRDLDWSLPDNPPALAASDRLGARAS
jgi:hypothetical protein